MFGLRHRDFEQDRPSTVAYRMAVETATSSGVDPHIRWRARIFEYFLKLRLPGKCVELGTAHGFMFYYALTKFNLENYDFRTSEIFLVDKFNTQRVDHKSGVVLNDVETRYAANLDLVKQRFKPFAEVSCVQGLIPEVLSEFDTSNISFLHIDLNAAQPEVAALRILWEQLAPNAIVLLDDYGFPDFAASQMAHSALAQELGYEILGLPTGQGLIIKS
jgi:O-methyltransferase